MFMRNGSQEARQMSDNASFISVRHSMRPTSKMVSSKIDSEKGAVQEQLLGDSLKINNSDANGTIISRGKLTMPANQ